MKDVYGTGGKDEITVTTLQVSCVSMSMATCALADVIVRRLKLCDGAAFRIGNGVSSALCLRQILSLPYYPDFISRMDDEGVAALAHQ